MNTVVASSVWFARMLTSAFPVGFSVENFSCSSSTRRHFSNGASQTRRVTDRGFYCTYAAAVTALGVLFSWAVFSGEIGTSYFDGYRSDDGLAIFALSFATIIFLTAFRYLDKLWLMVVSAVIAAVMVAVAAQVMGRLQGAEWYRTREYNVGYGIYVSLAASCVLMLPLGLLFWDWERPRRIA